MNFLRSNASAQLNAVLDAFEEQGDQVDGGPSDFSTKCPRHEGDKLSLSIADGEDGVILKCHAGCAQHEMFNAVVAYTGLDPRDFFYKQKGPAADAGPVVTIAELAAAKKLPIEWFTWAGMTDSPKGILIPYRDGWAPPRVRIRLSLKGKKRFSWGLPPHEGHSITAFGAWRLPEFRFGGTLYLVEGETDTITGWLYNLPVIGIPGKTMARSVLANNPHLVAGISNIFVIEEPDDFRKRQFLNGVRRALSDIHSQARVFPMRLPEKDMAELHLKRGPEGFWPAFQQAWATAVDAPTWPDPLPIPPAAVQVCATITATGFPDIFRVREIQRRLRKMKSVEIQIILEGLEQANIIRRLAPAKNLGRPVASYRTNPKARL